MLFCKWGKNSELCLAKINPIVIVSHDDDNDDDDDDDDDDD